MSGDGDVGPKEFVETTKARLQNNGWNIKGGKQVGDTVVYKITTDGTNGVVMSIPSNNANVTEEHLKKLLDIKNQLGADVAGVATQCDYTDIARQLLRDNDIREISVQPDTQTDSTSPPFALGLFSRRKALLAGGVAGGFGLIGTASMFIGSNGDIVGGGTIDTVDKIATDDSTELRVELNDDSLITNVHLRDDEGEVVQRGDAQTGSTFATIEIKGDLGTRVGAGEYEVIVTEEGEVIDQEPIEITTGEMDIEDVNIIIERDDALTPMYTNFEIEYSISDGDIPLRLVGMRAVEGVPNPNSPAENDDFSTSLETNTTDTYGLPGSIDNHVAAYPLGTSKYSSTSLSCTGESETALIRVKYTAYGLSDIFVKELEVTYELDGEIGQSPQNTEGCSEGSVTDWEVVDEYTV